MTSPLQGEDRRFDSAPAHHSRRKQKMLGQNFLIDNNIAKKIVEVSSIEPDEKILEIGPGRGALTELLIEKGNLLAVEKDKWLAVVLKQKYGKLAQIIDCLLYTSPSPRDATLSRMPSSA